MKMHKYFKLSIAVLVIQLAVVLWLGFSLPADTKIPIHWNIKNEIDGYASRNMAVFPFWLFNLGLFLLMMFSARLSPVFQQNRERYDAVIPPMTLVLVFFFALFHVYMLLLGHYPWLEDKLQIIYILIGALFICLGNILPKLPRNYIAGIKTPWTIYSDEIWRRTSRLGGFSFVILGLLMLVKGLFNLQAAWLNYTLLALLGFLVLGPVLYSFALYQKEKKNQ